MRTVVDRDGRLLGRINVVDATLIAFAVLLIPIAYVSFLLFRLPQPRVTSVEPAQLTYVEGRAAGGTELSGKLKVHGRNLRPVLRATVGTQDAVAFIFENPGSADVLFGTLPVGSHDLVLYDGVQEIARVPNAVTIPPRVSSSARVRVVGNLIDLDEAAARSIEVGAKSAANGRPEWEIVALGEPIPDLRDIRLQDGLVAVRAQGRWQRQAAIVITCDVGSPLQCQVPPVTLGGNAALLTLQGSGATLRLRVEEIVPADPPLSAEVRIRFFAPADAVNLVSVGDRDDSAPAVDGRAATIASVDKRQLVPGDVTLAAAADDIQPPTTIRAVDRVAAIDTVVRLGVDAAPEGWRYRSHRLSVGQSLTFLTPRYTVRGLVQSITISHGQASERR